MSWSLTGLSSEGTVAPCLGSSCIPVPESQQGSVDLGEGGRGGSKRGAGPPPEATSCLPG